MESIKQRPLLSRVSRCLLKKVKARLSDEGSATKWQLTTGAKRLKSFGSVYCHMTLQLHHKSCKTVSWKIHETKWKLTRDRTVLPRTTCHCCVLTWFAHTASCRGKLHKSTWQNHQPQHRHSTANWMPLYAHEYHRKLLLTFKKRKQLQPTS